MLTRTADLPTGITMAYALEGPADAPVQALVHDLGSNLRQFAREIERFRDRYRVLVPSLRGPGETTNATDPEDEDYAPAALARDVAALLDHLRVEALHYVGNSLGGLVGYELLRAHPGRLRSLATFGTTAELRSPRWPYWLTVGSVRLLGVGGIARTVGASASRDKAVGAELERMYRLAIKAALLRIPRHIARNDYTTTADAGHFANMEQPQRFAAILHDFQNDAAGRAMDSGAAAAARRHD